LARNVDRSMGCGALMVSLARGKPRLNEPFCRGLDGDSYPETFLGRWFGSVRYQLDDLGRESFSSLPKKIIGRINPSADRLESQRLGYV
jgi:hypothetical protein